MLCHKHRVPAHGCLLTIVGNLGRCQALGNKGFRMVKYSRQAFLLQIKTVSLVEVKTGAEPGTLQCLKQLIQITHGRKKRQEKALVQLRQMQVPQFGGFNRCHADHSHGHQAAEHHGRDQAHQPGCQAGLKRAKFIR